MTLIDQHTLTATIAGRTVAVDTCEVTFDRTWSPYVQGRATVAADGIFSFLDPRKRPLVTLAFVRRYSASRTIGYVSATRAGRTLGSVSAEYAGKTTDQESLQWREAWNGPTGPAGVASTLDVQVWLTSAKRNRTDPQLWDITFDGAELHAQTYTQTSSVWTPSITPATIRNLILLVLNQVGTTLRAGSADAPIPADDDGQRNPEWMAGVTAWDYLQPILDAEDLRLYADETGAWYLIQESATSGTCVLGAEATEVEDEWTATDRFYDGAVLVYEWETKSGVQKRAVDAHKRGNVHCYTATIEGRLTKRGRAKRIVDRAYKRALAQRWEAVADYRLRPGQVATLTPDSKTGVVDAVTFRYPDNKMTVTVIDVQ